MNLIFDYEITLDLISLIMRVVAIMVTFLFIIPLQLKQAHVKNGLSKLRKQLLYMGTLFMALNLFGIIIVFFRLILTPGSYVFFTHFISIANALAFIGLAYFGYKIYHEQYEE